MAKQPDTATKHPFIPEWDLGQGIAMLDWRDFSTDPVVGAKLRYEHVMKKVEQFRNEFVKPAADDFGNKFKMWEHYEATITKKSTPEEKEAAKVADDERQVAQLKWQELTFKLTALINNAQIYRV